MSPLSSGNRDMIHALASSSNLVESLFKLLLYHSSNSLLLAFSTLSILISPIALLILLFLQLNNSFFCFFDNSLNSFGSCHLKCMPVFPILGLSPKFPPPFPVILPPTAEISAAPLLLVVVLFLATGSEGSMSETANSKSFLLPGLAAVPSPVSSLLVVRHVPLVCHQHGRMISTMIIHHWISQIHRTRHG